MFRKIIFALTIFLLTLPSASADEGMWLPILMKEQKYAQMRKQGLKLSAEEIYAVNKACLADAVIGLMSEGSNMKSFCTASFVSGEGLIVTNYHCVMSYIEQISTVDNNFLQFGYWASKLSEETRCYNLMAKQLMRMEDVTGRMLAGTEGLSGTELTNKINDNGVAIAKEMTKNTGFEAQMQTFFGGNQYIISIYRVFEDIRVVAAPPTSLGRFGGNTDNWQWPRHTADFAFLRIYAKENNAPAKYEKSNVPYKPESYLKVSKKGLNDGDFAMIAGYPGSTMFNVPSFGLDKIINAENKAKIAIGGEKLTIMEQAITENPALRLRYFSRMSSTANKYLRMKGENSGVYRMNLIEVKRQEEQQFRRWVAEDPARQAKYGDVLDRMEQLYLKLADYNLANAYFLDAGISGSEIVPFIGKFEKLLAIYAGKKFRESEAKSEARRLVGLTKQFFNNWDYEIDRKMFRNVMVRYWDAMSDPFVPAEMKEYITKYGGDVEKLTQEVFRNSIFTNPEALLEFLESEKTDGVGIMRNDPLYQLSIGYYKINVNNIARQRGELQAQMTPLYKLYQKGLLEMNAGKTISPDANYSFRISYGKVSGVKPQDGMQYNSFTTLGGMRDKNAGNSEMPDFQMPKKLLALYEAGDYGTYANADGQLPVCFLTNCHTTSGNSGSPVMNGNGELVGLNFDRIQQGIASDYRFDPEVCRNICVDIRFVLFLLEKYAPEQYVLNELTIVK